VLAQRQSPGGNEVAAALAVVGLLDLEATTVTADALHANRKMAEAIRARGGDYVLAVKANQSSLFAYVKAFLTRAPRRKQSAIELACERGTTPPVSSHGRREQRRTIVMALPEGTARRFKFAGLTAVARIDATRRIGKHVKRESRYFLLSRKLTPAQLLSTVRAHWSIENQQHWVLDVVLNEDRARARKDNAAQNIALLRRLALNVLQNDPFNASVRRKINRASWQEEYLFSLFAQMR